MYKIYILQKNSQNDQSGSYRQLWSVEDTAAYVGPTVGSPPLTNVLYEDLTIIAGSQKRF